MTTQAKTHYVNADFDLGLRPRPGWEDRPSLVRQVDELSLQALLGAENHDAALVRCFPGNEFLDFLHDRGIPVPRLFEHPNIDPQARLQPLGWSAEAMRLNEGHASPADHPRLEVIEQVNARSFSRDLEASLDPDLPRGTLVASPGDVVGVLQRGHGGDEWILKAEHGNSGLANRRLRGSVLTDPDRRFLENTLAEDDRLVMEPWLDRTRDWCVVFDAPLQLPHVRIHETVYTRDGALIGALFDPATSLPDRQRGELETMAAQVADHLLEFGYQGPVCVDAFEFRSEHGRALRPLADLNCRRSMTDGAYRLWRRIAPDRCFYYRFFNHRKLSLPDTLPLMNTALEEHGYHAGSRCGVLPVSPLRLGHAREVRPSKFAVIFAAPDREGVLRQEHWFRERFETS